MNNLLQTLQYIPPHLAQAMMKAVSADLDAAAKAMAGASDLRVIGQAQARFDMLTRIRDELVKHHAPQQGRLP